MIVYYGSYMVVTLPDTIHIRKAVDFGPRFYAIPMSYKKENVRKSITGENGYSFY